MNHIWNIIQMFWFPIWIYKQYYTCFCLQYIFFRFLFLVIPQITWDQEGQLLIFPCFIFWLLHCWSSQLDMEKTKAYLSNVLIVGISKHFIVGNPWVGTCVGHSHWKNIWVFWRKRFFLKEKAISKLREGSSPATLIAKSPLWNQGHHLWFCAISSVQPCLVAIVPSTGKVCWCSRWAPQSSNRGKSQSLHQIYQYSSDGPQSC